MLNSRLVFAAVIPAILVSGCSTRPRNFAASVSAPVTDRVAFEQDYRACDSMVKAGGKTAFRDAALTGAGAAGAGAVFGAGAISAASTWTAAGAVSTAIPFVGAFAGFGINRAIRGSNERKMKRAMSDCLAEYGYTVGQWQKLPKKADAARYSADHAANAIFVPPVSGSGEMAEHGAIEASLQR